MPWSTEFNNSVTRLYKRVGQILEKIDIHNYELENKHDEVSEFFQDYPHSYLTNVTSELRKAFSYALTEYRTSNMNSIYLTIPLAVLIGSEYTLNINPEKMGRSVHGDYFSDPTGTMFDTHMPIKYEEQKKIWPEIRKLQALSLKARFAFVLTIQYFDRRIGLAEYDRVNPRKSAFIDQGLRELIRRGFIGAKPNVKQRLMISTVKELKQFAADEGLKIWGRKSELAQALVEQLSEQRITDYFFEKSISNRYLEPRIFNPKLFKKCIWAETHRLELDIIPIK